MHIIFAVSKAVKSTYVRLEKSISGTTDQTGELDEDSKNIISLVERAYDVIHFTVTS
jgi:hypothetical protein